MRPFPRGLGNRGRVEATYYKGHAGLTLLLTSLTLMALPPSDSALQVLILSTALSTLPDIDLELRRLSRHLHHRGPTHSILFALMAGLILGLPPPIHLWGGPMVPDRLHLRNLGSPIASTGRYADISPLQAPMALVSAGGGPKTLLSRQPPRK